MSVKIINEDGTVWKGVKGQYLKSVEYDVDLEGCSGGPIPTVIRFHDEDGAYCAMNHATVEVS